MKDDKGRDSGAHSGPFPHVICLQLQLGTSPMTPLGVVPKIKRKTQWEIITKTQQNVKENSMKTRSKYDLKTIDKD